MSAEISDKSTAQTIEQTLEYISEGSLENFLKKSLQELLKIPLKEFSKKNLIQLPKRFAHKKKSAEAIKKILEEFLRALL